MDFTQYAHELKMFVPAQDVITFTKGLFINIVKDSGVKDAGAELADGYTEHSYKKFYYSDKPDSIKAFSKKLYGYIDKHKFVSYLDSILKNADIDELIKAFNKESGIKGITKENYKDKLFYEFANILCQNGCGCDYISEDANDTVENEDANDTVENEVYPSAKEKWRQKFYNGVYNILYWDREFDRIGSGRIKLDMYNNYVVLLTGKPDDVENDEFDKIFDEPEILKIIIFDMKEFDCSKDNCCMVTETIPHFCKSNFQKHGSTFCSKNYLQIGLHT